MNADLIERNTAAHRNGEFCEKYAREVIPGLEWKNGIYDALLNGVPLDVKSCQAWYKRLNHPTSTRKAGMVTLYPEQDAELKEHHGLYFCIVHFGELVVKSFFVPAEKVPDRRQISWTTLQKLAVVV
ncbi:MAG: hypothetical protein PHU51_05700 [Candidatus Nanoarchaeia archaeon]|nr:hypothetical protein [Candidatus Nanoarchaeia archaeon]